VEPDSREPWFMCEAHGLDESCLTDTLKAMERAVDLTLETLERTAPVKDAIGG
jgi:glutamate-1-semialdehyde 2,1-aminomutase